MTGDYKLIILSGAIVWDILSSAKSGTTYHEVFTAMVEGKPEALVDNDNDLKQMMLDDPKYVSFGSPLGYKHPKLVASDIIEAIDSPLGELGGWSRLDALLSP